MSRACIRQVAETTIAQILSHSAGLVRDGTAAGQFSDSRPFLSTEELIADLKSPPVIEPNTRFKYSNHGYGLIGLVIEAITKEPYRVWIEREIVDAAGLHETQSGMPLAKGTPFARGHSPRLPVGRRLVIPGDNIQNAITPAGGFVSTAADVARFFAQLAPNAKRSVLSAASRREMTRRHWRNPHSSIESYYGLGIASGTVAGWDWFGHGGGLQGYISQTWVIPACEMTISVLTNSTDGWAGFWVDGAMRILRSFRGARRAETARPRLDRTLVELMGRVRSRSDGKRRAGRQPARHQSVSGCDAKSRSPAATPAASHWPPAREATAKPCASPATRPARSPKCGSRAAKGGRRRSWRRRWSEDTGEASAARPVDRHIARLFKYKTVSWNSWSPRLL